MLLRTSWVFSFVLLLVPTFATHAENKESYESLFAKALASGEDCQVSDLPDAIRVACEKEITVWFFTKPNHFAHPGVVMRKAEDRNGQLYMSLRGWSFGPDSAQPAFKAWLEQFQALTDKLRNEGQAPQGPQ